MVPSNVQQIYDAYISGMSATERLRLVELITRGMAQPDPELTGTGIVTATGTEVEIHTTVVVPESATAAAVAALRSNVPGWQSTDRRGDLTEWRDRAL